MHLAIESQWPVVKGSIHPNKKKTKTEHFCFSYLKCYWAALITLALFAPSLTFLSPFQHHKSASWLYRSQHWERKRHFKLFLQKYCLSSIIHRPTCQQFHRVCLFNEWWNGEIVSRLYRVNQTLHLERKLLLSNFVSVNTMNEVFFTSFVLKSDLFEIYILYICKT